MKVVQGLIGWAIIGFVAWVFWPSSDEAPDETLAATNVAPVASEPVSMAVVAAEPEPVMDLGVTVGDVLDVLAELVEGEVLDELPEMITESDEEYWYLDVQSDEASTDLVLYGVLDHDDPNQKSRLLTEVHFLQEVVSDPVAVVKGLAILGAVGKAVASDWSDPVGDVDSWLQSGQDEIMLVRWHGPDTRNVTLRKIQIGFNWLEMRIEPS